MTNSRRKGKDGELEFAHVLLDHGLEARRGQQFKGGAGSPDVVCPDLKDIHFEVKRTENTSLEKWIEQATNDAPKGSIPIVAHRKSRGQWLAILPMSDMLRLLIMREITRGS